MDTPGDYEAIDKPFLVSLNKHMKDFTVILTVIRLTLDDDPNMPPVYRTGECAYRVSATTAEAAVHEAMRGVIANRELPPLMSVRVTAVLLGICDIVPRSTIGVAHVAASLDFIETVPGEDWFDSPEYQAMLEDD